MAKRIWPIHWLRALPFLAGLSLFAPACSAGAADGPVSAASLPTVNNRGLVALPTDGGVFLGWRMLPGDDDDMTFRIYRASSEDGPFELVAQTRWTSYQAPRTPGIPCFYQVRLVQGEREVAATCVASVAPDAPPTDGIILTTGIEPEKQSVDARRHVDRCVPADLDGDGVFDYVIIFPKNSVDPYYWKPSAETLKLRAINGRSGQVMWTRDMGMGIEMGVWYSPFAAYDLDGDGCAEVITLTNDRPVLQKLTEGYKVRGGVERLTILDGPTGRIRAQAPWPSRAGFESYNYVNRNLIAVAYLDGQRPYIVVNRGTYATAKLEAWSFDGRELKAKWRWSTRDPGMSVYAGSGSHSSLVADIDGDGMDEFFWGCVCIDGDGEEAKVKWAAWMPGFEGKYTLGHVDTVSFGDVLPDVPGPEVYYTTEHNGVANVYGWGVSDPRKGSVLVAADGTRHWIYRGGKHVDTGWVADVIADADHPGWECHYRDGGDNVARLCRSDGSVIVDNADMPKNVEWDGDDTIELIDENGHIHDYGQPPQFKMGDHAWVTMCVGDFIGDYREEMVVRLPDGRLKILTNTQPLEARRPSPLFDRTYRLSLAAYGAGYVGLPARGGQTWLHRACAD